MGYKAGDPRNYAGVKRWRATEAGRRARRGQQARRVARDPKAHSDRVREWRKRNLSERRAKEAAYARTRRTSDPAAQRRRMERFKEKQEAKLLDMAGRPRPTICELCGESMKVSNFDHDHATGHFRGWLCQRCNRTLGQVKDSVELLRKMIGWVIDGGIGHGQAQLQEARESTEEFIRDSVQENKEQSGG